MSDEIDMNCLGMKCPRPIIEIAKAARKLPAGTLLRVVADDLAFESDVMAWAEHTQASIVSIERDGDQVTVQIELAR